MIKRKISIFDQNEIFCKHESTIASLLLLEHTSKVCLKFSQKQIILSSNEKFSKTSSKSNMNTINDHHVSFALHESLVSKNKFSLLDKLNTICVFIDIA